MLNLLSLFVLFNCPEINKINQSEEAWNILDMKNMRYSQTRCSKIYKDAPCLKTFIKRNPRNYWAICGKEI